MDGSKLGWSGFGHMQPEDIQRIHRSTLKVLEKTGLFVEDPKTVELFADYGARVESQASRVKFPPNLVEEAVQSAPSQILLAGRNPEDDVLLDTHATLFFNSSSNINLTDPATGQIRRSTKSDLGALTRLCNAVQEIGIISRAVYPLDQPSDVLHLHTAEACLLNTTKHSFHGPESEWEMRRIEKLAEAWMGGPDTLKVRRPISFVASLSSPLKLTRSFCEIARASAGSGFSTVVASMAMAGSTGPVNLAGLLVQTNAEILAGIVLTQLVKKGAPVIYASYSTGMDLRLGSAPMGSPETALVASAVAQLSRSYQLPCQVPGLTSDSKEPGTQAAFEKTMTGLTAAMAGAQLISGIGGLETGLTFDPAQALLDAEMVRMIRHFENGIKVDEETLSTEIIHEVGPFGNYLTHDSTLRNMRSLSQVDLFDRSHRFVWEKKSKPRSYDKAFHQAKKLMNCELEIIPESAVQQIREIVLEAEKESTMMQS